MTESKPVLPETEGDGAESTVQSLASAGNAEDVEAGGVSAEDILDGSAEKKKKSKRSKMKKVLTGGVGSNDESSSSSNPASKLTSGQLEQLLEVNPALKSEVSGMNKEQAVDRLKKLDVADLLTGMVWHLPWKGAMCLVDLVLSR